MTEKRKQKILQIAAEEYKRKHGTTDADDDDVLELVRDKFQQNFIVNDARSEKLSKEEDTIIIVIEPRHQFREIFEYCVYVEEMRLWIMKNRTEYITAEEMKANNDKAYPYAMNFFEFINGRIENVRDLDKDKGRGESR